MTHDHHAPHDDTHRSDMKAAFLGLIIGAIVLFCILRTIVAITHSHYENEKPAAASTR
jgi:hypothetical protein